jgi:hypothetical protein
MDPDILTDPVIAVFVLILKPDALNDAVFAPFVICDKFNPVTPVAGILNNFVPSPTNDPENDPVLYDDVKEFKLPVVDSIRINFSLINVSTFISDDDNVEIELDIEELNEENPVVPVIIICDEPEINDTTFETIFPLTFNEPDIFCEPLIMTSPLKLEEPETINEPVTSASNIFM